MRNNRLKLIFAGILIMAGSCNDPKTVVTNIVYRDGSVLRKIEIRNSENNLKVSNTPIPYDNSWTIKDSVEISQNGDTTWVRRAQKLFKGTDAINNDYKTDSSYDKGVSRRAEFRKKFKWFTTEYRYNEIINGRMKYGYPVSDFLNPDEIKWFYSPDNLTEEKKNGPDSLKYRAFADTINNKIEKWTIKCVVSEWIHEFSRLSSVMGTGQMSLDSLMQHVNDYYNIIVSNTKDFDSLWTNGIILREIIGENNLEKYKTAADSAMHTTTEKVFFDFRNYTLRTLMPGKLISTTGMVDSTGYVFWPVKSDYILTGSYEMRAESKVANRWAWIVSVLFLLFVAAGMIFKKIRKG